MVGSGLSNQTGAAIGSLGFPVLGPVGVVAVRQYVAAVVLMAVGRPRLRTFTWGQWWPVVLLALVFGTMNLSLYTAIDRIGLGLAVTLEFLGPLSIALAASRRRVDACCAVIAAAGVVTLMRPRPSADFLGMGLGLLAAGCWASYILLNRTVGRRIPGAAGSAAAAGLSAVLFLPVGVAVVVRHPPTPTAVCCAVAMRRAVLRGALPRGPVHPAPRPGPGLRSLHERQSRPGRSGRVDRPRSEPGLDGVDGHRLRRRGQRARHSGRTKLTDTSRT